jgi:glycosyltransferase involved in cell wall biosynthesis
MTLESTVASLTTVEPAHDTALGTMRRVAIIVGDQKTLHCGVKDSARILARVLQNAGFAVDIIAPVSWRPADVIHLVRQIRNGKYDILHIQYPSIGYRYSIVPHLLGLFRLTRGTVVTLHEYSALKRPQRLSTQLFRLSAGVILFGSEFERARYNRRLGTLGSTQDIFPILSNVPAVPSTSGRDHSVVYFGQIRPHKGLEAFLELARLTVEQQRPFKFHIIGSVSESGRDYAQGLQEQAPEEIRWSFDLPFEDIGKILGQSFAAYLPFPDGASERRGSLLAAALNGLPILSRIGPATVPSLRALILAVDAPEQALVTLEHLAASPEDWQSISERALAYAQKSSWEDVGRSHAKAYNRLLRS